jgi:hypothetical protein
VRTRPVLAIALLAVTAAVSSGCDVLAAMIAPPGGAFPSLGPEPSFDPNSSEAPGFSLPPPTATYDQGKATVTIDKGAPVTLGSLAGSAALIPDFGLIVTWTDDKGMYLRLASYGPSDSMLMVDRIADGQHWTAWNSDTACTVAFSHPADKTGVTGTASCRDLRWTDMMQAGPDGNSLDVPGQQPFDLEAAFSAS